MVELFVIRGLLAGVANNVNQAARHANAGDEFPADATAALMAVRRLAARIDGTINDLGAGRWPMAGPLQQSRCRPPRHVEALGVVVAR